MRLRIAFVAVLVSASALSNAASAACVNRFFADHTQSASHEVTLLTGKVTYQEVQGFRQKPSSLAWVDEKGVRIAVAVEVRALRPMPVSCDGKPSGVVMQARFITMRHPAKVMLLKIGDASPVEFEEQAQ